jgi:hypothetical protein
MGALVQNHANASGSLRRMRNKLFGTKGRQQPRGSRSSHGGCVHAHPDGADLSFVARAQIFLSALSLGCTETQCGR